MTTLRPRLAAFALLAIQVLVPSGASSATAPALAQAAQETIPETAQQPPAAPATPATPATAGEAPAGAKLAPRRFEVRRATSAIRVDASLDEPAWAGALVYDLPYEWSPGDNTPPPVKTDFLLTYDDDNLYAAWRAQDPDPGEIRAHLMDRDLIDTLVQDDHVVLMIDPFNDERRGLQFRVNPLGVQADAIFSENEGIEDFSFDMIWASAGRITPEGWIVEIAIPLNQIRFPRTAGAQTWGFDVGRSYPRSVRHRIIAWPRDRDNACLLCQVDKVTGFENLEPGRNLELDPTLTARRTDELASSGSGLESGETETDPGLSARWGVTPNISLNAAVNPDFSQVEADVAQLDVNERFALFFPEKRPFFLEGVDYFATPLQAVFTRTVADPDWGVKVTGKEGGNTFGVFLAEDTDEGNGIILPSNQASDFAVVPGSIDSGVLRYRRDIGAASTLGLLYAGRRGEQGYENGLYGLDGFLRLDPSNSVRFQALRSDTRYPGALAAAFGQPTGELGGEAFLVDYDYTSRDWGASAFYQDLDPGFRADSGFIPRVDIRDAQLFGQRNIWGEAGQWYTLLEAGVFLQRIEDHGGRLTDELLNVFGTYQGALQSSVVLSLNRHKTRFGDVLYEGLNRGDLTVSLQPSGAARLTLFADYGDTVDFERNRPADLLQLSPGIELKLGRHVNAKLDHALRRLTADGDGDGGGDGAGDAGTILTANLTQLRLVYNFSVRMFVRGIFQYLDLEPGAAGSAEIDGDGRSLFTQLLFSYKLNPQTVLFVGYSDNYSDDGAGAGDLALDRTDRTFFMKLGYAWIL